MKTLMRSCDLIWVAFFGEVAPFDEKSNIEGMRESCLKGAVVGCLIGSAYGSKGAMIGCIVGVAACGVPFIVRDLRNRGA